MNTFKRIFTKHFSAVIALGLLVFIGLACNSEADWENELGGKQLTYAKTSGSFSDRVDIWFCPSGEYAVRSESSGFSGGGSGTLSTAGENGDYGQWRVDGSTLILRSQNGQVTEYELSKGSDDSVVKLNGRGYLVRRHDKCR